MEEIIRTEHLSYTYDTEKAALHDISVSIHKGERIAIIGSNGAGKSTFFLNLNGVLTGSEGTVYFHGKPIGRKNKDLNELRKKVGIVFQDADNQIIASTVMAEVSFGPMNMGLPRDTVMKRVDEALEYMNISDFKHRPAHYLSGGEKKRVSIADIIAMKPEVIIFDEPTASLDPVNAQMFEEVLDKLEKEQTTLLVSTHDVDFTYRWAKRVLVFSNGQIIADGTPDVIFRQEEILKRANLKKPILLEICELLEKKGILPQNTAFPGTISELEALI
ncbi:MAG: energy-coupling factor ABC transporter ATP-binding protein [Lachnospiraceae bacterium]|nr:energy-coupling factor ABC transporter ATP-binding protein [Lachnospiraceae bacterium]